MLRTWVSTVRSKMHKRVPICLLLRPSATRAATSRSRLANWSTGPAKADLDIAIHLAQGRPLPRESSRCRKQTQMRTTPRREPQCRPVPPKPGVVPGERSLPQPSPRERALTPQTAAPPALLVQKLRQSTQTRRAGSTAPRDRRSCALCAVPRLLECQLQLSWSNDADHLHSGRFQLRIGRQQTTPQ